MGAKHCAALDDRQLESLPTLQMGFAAHGGVGGLVIRPRHYMVEYPRLLKTRLRRVFSTRAAEHKQVTLTLTLTLTLALALTLS